MYPVRFAEKIGYKYRIHLYNTNFKKVNLSSVRSRSYWLYQSYFNFRWEASMNGNIAQCISRCKSIELINLTPKNDSFLILCLRTGLQSYPYSKTMAEKSITCSRASELATLVKYSLSFSHKVSMSTNCILLIYQKQEEVKSIRLGVNLFILTSNFTC